MWARSSVSGKLSAMRRNSLAVIILLMPGKSRTSAASRLSRSAALLMRSRSRACNADLARSRRYLRSTPSMNAERECFDPARRSTLFKTSLDSVIEVFSFILPSYYHWTESCKARSQPGKEGELKGILRHRVGSEDGGD